MKSLQKWFLLVALASTIAYADKTWTMVNPHVWSRDNTSTLTTTADGVLQIRHTGDADWSLHGVSPVVVKPGEVYRISCTSQALPDMPNARPYGLSVILRDAQNKVMYWCYASRQAKPGMPLETKFMIPPQGAKIEPRVVGDGATAVGIIGFKLTYEGMMIPADQPPPKDGVLETDTLKVVLAGEGAGLTITDKRTGRIWKPALKGNQFVTSIKVNDSSIIAKFINPATLQEGQVEIIPEHSKPELLVTVTGEGVMSANVDYPVPFETCAGERLIIPMNEGISFPVDEENAVPGRLITYGGHGLCMSFFGVQNDSTGSGYMGIVETPDDAAVVFNRPYDTGNYTAGVSWENQCGNFGYTRKVRFVFFDKGGYVAMCKRYRAYAKSIGKFKDFTAKAKERPLVDRLLGAPNIWCWEPRKIEMAKELKAAGIERFLWSGDGSPEEVKAMAQMDGVLISRYDVYQDIYHPDQLKKLGWKRGCNTEAWPKDIIWNSPNSNDWRHAWGVKAPDGTWTYCAMMCDSVAPLYERRNVIKELKYKPFNTRFIDTTVAAPWQTCFNPAHPMTHSDSRFHKMELLRILGDEFGLVVGSETGHDASVPYCDYYEGMLSLGPYRVPDSGRNIPQIWTNVPPRVAKYQMGEAYRLPLWELVYHECVCAHWYWGDYNNKLPALWAKRDLFNALYGTMGMYIFNRKQWAEDREKFVRSYRITSPIARKTGYSEMIDHQILTPDRTVQRSIFANGVTVTVNFGNKPYQNLKPGEYQVTGL